MKKRMRKKARQGRVGERGKNNRQTGWQQDEWTDRRKKKNEKKNDRNDAEVIGFSRPINHEGHIRAKSKHTKKPEQPSWRDTFLAKRENDAKKNNNSNNNTTKQKLHYG